MACAFSTTSTTGSYWLSLKISYANTGIWYSRTSASWAFGSAGKRANSCRCRGSLFSVWSLDSVNQTARLMQERAQSVLNCLNTFKNRTAAPLKQFQRLLRHMAAAAAVTPLGLLHMRPLQHWLHGRVPRWAWQSGTLRVQVTPACRQTFTPWSDLSFLRAGVPLQQVSRHAVVYTDASAKGWGATFNVLAVSGVWTGPQLHWHINCLELLAVHLVCLAALSVEDAEDIYLFDTMITGILLIGLGFTLGYRKIRKTGTAVQSLTRLPVLIEAVGRAVSNETETINRNMDAIMMNLTALQVKLGDFRDQNGQRE